MLFPMLRGEILQFGMITKHTWEWEIDERNLKIMNLTIFILKGYKIGEKNISSVNIRFAAKSSDIRNFSQNIRSGNTDTYHPRVHIRKVPGLWRINYTSIDTVGSSNVKLVSTLAEHSNTQLLLYMVVQYKPRRNEESCSIFLKSRKCIAAWCDNKCVATPCGQSRRHGGALVGEAPTNWNIKH